MLSMEQSEKEKWLYRLEVGICYIVKILRIIFKTVSNFPNFHFHTFNVSFSTAHDSIMAQNFYLQRIELSEIFSAFKKKFLTLSVEIYFHVRKVNALIVFCSQ